MSHYMILFRKLSLDRWSKSFRNYGIHISRAYVTQLRDSNDCIPYIVILLGLMSMIWF